VLSRYPLRVQDALRKNPVLSMLAIEMHPWVLSFLSVSEAVPTQSQEAGAV
jgi:hypothetical protein